MACFSPTPQTRLRYSVKHIVTFPQKKRYKDCGSNGLREPTPKSKKPGAIALVVASIIIPYLHYDVMANVASCPKKLCPKCGAKASEGTIFRVEVHNTGKNCALGKPPEHPRDPTAARINTRFISSRRLPGLLRQPSRVSPQLANIKKDPDIFRSLLILP